MADVIAGLKLVSDSLLGIMRSYGSLKKDFFENHIEPLHERMLAIHKDYSAGFEEACQFLKSGDKPPSAVVEFLEQRRRQYVTERDLAATLAQALSEVDKKWGRDEVWTTLREFCNAIVAYFSAASRIGGISWYSEFIDSVRFKSGLRNETDVWSAGFISGNPRGDLLEEVKLVIDVLLPRAFGPINSHYSALRAKLL